MRKERPSAIILYHFFYPDDVVSARHFSQFAEELVKRGWDVTVLTSNRRCRYPDKEITKRDELWQSINIIRIWRPAWNQANRFSRLANSLWMIIGWGVSILNVPPADTIIVGSDPPFSALLFPILRFFKRGKILVHWCYDLYPEAIIADGAGRFVGWFANKLTIIMRWAYRSVDLMVDIGPCMKRRLGAYGIKVHSITLTPWALIETDVMPKPDTAIRSEMFKNANLVLFYSGNMGLAHDFSLFLELARRLYQGDPKVLICFACRGNRFEELKRAVRADDYNVHFAPFADEIELEKRLSAADIHLLSLRPEWEGIVVPSKFFGSLAVGRPVIYAGPEGSAIAQWIRKYNIGLILTKENMGEVAGRLIDLAKRPETLRIWQNNVFRAYNCFSKAHTMTLWDEILQSLINRESGVKLR